MEAGAHLNQSESLPFTWMRPAVGSMMPVMSLSIVLLPAPLAPMIPKRHRG